MVVPVQAKVALNLKVLRRHDPSITDILDTTSHCVVYDFDQTSSTWTKKGVEGTMFVVQRSPTSFGIFVLNRMATENYLATLSPSMEVQMLGDYVIFRLPDETVQGLWFYEVSDRLRITSTMQVLCAQSQQPVAVTSSFQHQNAYQYQQQIPSQQTPPLPTSTLPNVLFQQPPQPQPFQSLPQFRSDQNQYQPQPAYIPPQNLTGPPAQSHQFNPSYPQSVQGGVYSSQHPQQVNIMDLFARGSGPSPLVAPSVQHPPPPSVVDNVAAAIGLQQLQRSMQAAATPPPQRQQQQNQIGSLADVWDWVDSLNTAGVATQRRSLPDIEFRSRLAYLLQNPSFQQALYSSYVSNT